MSCCESQIGKLQIECGEMSSLGGILQYNREIANTVTSVYSVDSL